jgi:anthranilate synthase/aminodeoxychorismate synthase-like glutamine amidotransferase
MRVLMVDNYDSFTYNLVHLLEELGAEVVVRRSDEIDVDAGKRLEADRLVVSPGPGRPSGAGNSVALIRALGPTTPTLGVCLGHQAIVEAYGGDVGQARELVHGKATFVFHDGQGIFAGLPSPIPAGRYHSLGAAKVPRELEVTATAPDGEIMAVRHRTHPIEGVQFHPESVLTPEGTALLANFLAGTVGARREAS